MICEKVATCVALALALAGKVVRTYSSNRHKGIDIAGKRGDPVKAVAAGKVVYAGTGVTGYGSLLILNTMIRT